MKKGNPFSVCKKQPEESTTKEFSGFKKIAAYKQKNGLKTKMTGRQILARKVKNKTKNTKRYLKII